MVIVLFCNILIYLLYGNVSVPGCFCTVCGVWHWVFSLVSMCESCVPVQGLCHLCRHHRVSPLVFGLTAPQTELVFLSCTPCINKNNFCFLCEPAQSAAIPHPFVALETPTAREGTEYWGWGCASPTTSPIAGGWHGDVCGV